MFNKGQLAGLMKQAQAMQDNLKKARDRLAFIEVEGRSGAGLVKVVMTCKHDVKRITIDPSLLAEDRTCWKTWWRLRSMRRCARPRRLRRKMGKLTAGMPGLPGGMKFPFLRGWLPSGRSALLGGARNPHVLQVRSGCCAPPP